MTTKPGQDACALPYLACVPVSIALLFAICHAFQLFLSSWRPIWTLPFISEAKECHTVPLLEGKPSLKWTITLLAISAIGLSAELVQCMPPKIHYPSVALVASWVSGPPSASNIACVNRITGYDMCVDSSQTTKVMLDMDDYVLLIGLHS